MSDLKSKLTNTRSHLSPTLEKLLIREIQHELNNNLLYRKLQYRADCSGYKHSARMFAHQANGEYKHHKICLNFVLERGGNIEPALTNGNPEVKLSGLRSLYEAALEREQLTTKYLSEICATAFAENDKIVVAWIRPLMEEQIEEEGLFIQYLTELDAVGDDKVGLYLFDKGVK